MSRFQSCKMALDYEMIPGTAPPTLECEEDEESKVITGLRGIFDVGEKAKVIIGTFESKNLVISGGE